VGLAGFFILVRERWLWMSMIPAVLLVLHVVRTMKTTDPRLLDPELKKVAMTAFIISLLMFSIALAV